MPLISTHELCVAYGSKIALDSLSLEVPEGSVGLLGPNGAGKSTLLKTLLGFLTPKSGTAEVMGVNSRRNPLDIRSKVGLMPEQDCHIPGMTGLALVAYAGEMCGMPASQALRRGHEVLEYCGLGDARYRMVDTYSTGMLQRVKLAQALVHGPQMLLLDEPTNGLDPKGREEMLQLVYDIWHKFQGECGAMLAPFARCGARVRLCAGDAERQANRSGHHRRAAWRGRCQIPCGA